MKRRQFLRTLGWSALMPSLFKLPSEIQAAESAETRPILFGAFTKPFRDLDVEQTAEFVERVGWDGVELPVRSRNSHLDPEKVEEELPKMVEALRRRGKKVFLLTTDILEANSLAEKVLRTASALGIRQYRLGAFQYHLSKPLEPQLREIQSRLRGIADLNRSLNVQGCFQNHSGATYVGAPLWDVALLLRDFDSRDLGLCYDLGHSVIEGGKAWELNWRLVRSRMSAVFFKDFKWETEKGKWKPAWCPLGEGMLPRGFLADLFQSGYRGWINQHHEYDHGSGKDLLENCQRDLQVLKRWVAEALEANPR